MRKNGKRVLVAAVFTLVLFCVVAMPEKSATWMQDALASLGGVIRSAVHL
jgi:hypothetical protein